MAQEKFKKNKRINSRIFFFYNNQSSNNKFLNFIAKTKKSSPMGENESKMSRKSDSSSRKKAPLTSKTEADEEEQSESNTRPQKPEKPISKKNMNPCPLHDEQITMLCKRSQCYKLMCPECYQAHKGKHNQKEDLSDEILSKYHLIRCMGRGGFGLVFAVEHNFQKFALKIVDVFAGIEDSISENTKKEYLNEFKKEAEFHRELKHEYIVYYYDDFYIESEERLVIKMELCDSSLASKLDDLDEDQALVWFAQMCSAVSYLHESDDQKKKREIVHRDLKPGNVLIKEGKVKICDFGGAKLLTKTRLSASKTNKELFLGTQEYLAPEIFTQDVKNFTKATDIWALGIILFKMLNKGKHPLLYDVDDENFDRDMKIEKMKEAMDKYKDNQNEIKTLLKELPLGNILARCLQYDPKKRIEIQPLIGLIRDKLEDAGLDASSNLDRERRAKTEVSQLNFNSNKKEENKKKEEKVLRTKTQDPKSEKSFKSEVSYESKKSNSEDSETVNKRANELFKNGEYEKALNEYNDAIESNPSIAKFYSNKAGCLTKLHRYDEAMKNLTKCLQLDPKFVRAFARKGQIYIEKKEFENAFKAYQDGLKIDRNNKECLDGIDCINEEKAKEANRLKQNAEEYAINGNWGPCLENLNKAMQLSPNIGDLYQLKARFLFKMKNYDQAVIEGKRAVELEPYNSKEALQIIGDSLIILKRNEDAVIWLNKALQLDPSNQQLIAKIAKIKEGWTDQLYDKSDAFHKAKNLDLALDYINQALILQPKQIKYLLKKSYILDEKGDKKGALQILASILEIDKTNPDVWLYLAKIFMESKQVNLAAQCLQEGVNSNPLHIPLRQCLASVNMLIEKAVEINREGVELYQIGKFLLALKKFNEALEINPTVSNYYYNKAGALIKLDDYNAAMEANQKYLELDKTAAKGYAQKGLIHLALKQNMKAKQAFEEGLNHEPSNMECRNGLRDMNGTKNVDDLAKLLLLGALLENAKPQRPEPQLFFINRPGFNIFDL